MGITHPLFPHFNSHHYLFAGMGMLESLLAIWTVTMLVRFYYFNSTSVIEDQLERIEIIAKQRSSIYSEIEVSVRKHKPSPNIYMFSAERWTGKVMARDESGGESMVAFTPDFHSSKAAALNELEDWLLG
ncbi:hypothetical protein EKO04_009033 [Ascochyta lentis]|uniref:Uncharacterized protein n=1 Tax=Ascochyta lentis TaxID=205686 RepID=A0A8H7ME70_9PLEO|nr:hypothetical protein EKO04_009033 [Ascochyta lentis]